MSHKFKGSGDDQEEPGIDEEDDVRGNFFLQSSPPPALLLNLWLGRNDPESTLAVLRGHDDVVRIIYGLVVDWWRTSIVRGPGKVFAARIGAVKFPKNAGRYCNMMPIMLPTLREWRDATRDERPWVATIPDEFKAYIPLIEACPLTEADEGEIGYLTVDERATETDGQPQRRGGLHAESPGYVHLQPGGGGAWAEPPHPGALTFMWGGGHYISTSEEPHGSMVKMHVSAVAQPTPARPLPMIAGPQLLYRPEGRAPAAQETVGGRGQVADFAAFGHAGTASSRAACTWRPTWRAARGCGTRR